MKQDELQLFSKAMQHYQLNEFSQGFTILLGLSKNNHLEATKEVGYSYLLGLGCDEDIVLAYKYFMRADTHPESQFFLWHLLYFGYGVKANRKLALAYLKRSSDQGFSQSAVQLNLLSQMVSDSPTTEKLDHQSLNLLSNKLATKNHAHIINNHHEFLIQSVDHALPEAACEYLIRASQPFLKPSQTIHPVTHQPILNNIRTSSSATLDWLMETPCIAVIMESLALTFNQQLSHCENAAILNYLPGQEYQPHYDFIGNSANHHLVENPRKSSLIVYLNDVVSGGATSFPELKISIKPSTGRALYFENIDSQLHPILNSLHAGEPVMQGEKWVLVLWFRVKPYIRHKQFI